MVRLVERRRALGPKEIDAALGRMAAALARRIDAPERLALVGIRTGGVPLAERLARRLAESTGHEVALGTVDITLYRDDVFRGLPTPIVGPTEIDFAVGDREIVLVDDVLYTGRTVRAAIDAVMDLGRPRRILLAVLVDRGGRELPICPDVTGVDLTVAADESVQVLLQETTGEDAVVVRGVEAP
ncbi:MAG: bifunctional pyr operon transcriptional regulator/uracil phosphoribosyltransferase PyrR [Deltaproteobacteria bacterium]|nr:MAG: bifunctional pyr operon transcriptional regulator/uracil phosphoribosyltransferase PyrR [Deltaproteobacteria bacterium]